MLNIQINTITLLWFVYCLFVNVSHIYTFFNIRHRVNLTFYIREVFYSNFLVCVKKEYGFLIHFLLPKITLVLLHTHFVASKFITLNL